VLCILIALTIMCVPACFVRMPPHAVRKDTGKLVSALAGFHKRTQH